jgi:hypothetical protein
VNLLSLGAKGSAPLLLLLFLAGYVLAGTAAIDRTLWLLLTLTLATRLLPLDALLSGSTARRAPTTCSTKWYCRMARW